jgi:hypothetical protein
MHWDGHPYTLSQTNNSVTIQLHHRYAGASPRLLVVMPSLYVLGGRQRKLLLKQEEEWNLYDCALILKIDATTGAVETCLEYTTPQTARPHERSSSVFKSESRAAHWLVVHGMCGFATPCSQPCTV